MSKTRTDSDSDVSVSEKSRTKTPKQYRVLLLNDDYTTMDFVVHVLETIFMKTPAESVQVMLQVHKQGRGVAGVFTKQIAEAKAELTHQRAQAEGFPLKCVLEPE